MVDEVHEHEWKWVVGSAWFACACGDKCEAVPIARRQVSRAEARREIASLVKGW